MSCPDCGSVELRYSEQLGVRLWGQCRLCGSVYSVVNVNDLDRDVDPDFDENDPAGDPSQEWTHVRDRRL